MTLESPAPIMAAPGFLPRSLLGWHILNLLWTVPRHRSTSLIPEHGPPSAPQAQANELRALGYALASRHQLSWVGLQERARHRLRAFQATRLGPEEGVCGYTLALALHLRRTPADLRLAPAELGQALVTTALALEYLLVLDSTAEVPGPPTLTHPLLSPRDERLLEVTSALAALDTAPRLSPGYRVSGPDLRHLAEGLRGALSAEARVRRLGMGRVLREARDALTQRRVADDPDGLDTLRVYLLEAVSGRQHGLHALYLEGGLMLALEEVAARLTRQGQ